MNIRQLIVTVYLLLFVSVVVGSAVFFWQTRQEYNQLLLAERSTRQRLGEAQQRLKEQERELQRLRSDPAYVETIIRRRLGYARPDEFIYRFGEQADPFERPSKQ